MEEVAEKYDEISLIDNIIDHFNVISKRYKLILFIVLASVSATAAMSQYEPDIYKSSAVIMPVMSQQNQNGLTTVDQHIGISMPVLSNVSELESLLNSNILMEKVVRNRNFYPIFLNETYEENPGPDKIWKGIRFMQSIYKVNHNQKKGIITLAVEHTNPKTTADIISCVLSELTDYMSSEAKRVAGINRKYLETLIKKNADPLIKQKIYSLIARQIEISMMAEVKENFAFKVLDPPRAPDVKIKPTIKKDIIFSFIISLFAGLLIAFLAEYISIRVKK